ncbi:hypothetical protein D1610_00525 [Sphingomonas gilva]|uniref:Uncharacterized protein n=1 Tax=Sphingomonas gilva TaxID=2305907 RepID=A0A396RQB2_9SPHN|nr:hypothetical protein [Sphingomonas gilva]RHW18690.1 hypothetical protein D1610_00525 [Sphingomonas gilva]
MIADPETAPVAVPERRGLGTRALLILLLLALVLGVVLAGLLFSRWDGWRGWFGATRTSAPVTAPAATSQPSATQAVAVPDPYALAEIATRESQLSARIGALESRLALIDTRASAASGHASRAEGLLVAFAARRALDRGLGLGYLEGQLRDRFGATQPRAVAVTIQAARNPVTLEALRIGLDELAPELTTPANETSWWDAVRRELSSLIVLRKTGTPSPRSTDRLARARRMMEGGNVDAALAEVARLPGRDKAAAWMTAARRYIQARRALDVLETAAIVEPQRAAAAAAALPPPPTTTAPAAITAPPPQPAPNQPTE